MLRHYLAAIISAGLVLAQAPSARAGNPDRQGEAGAYELLLNPFARSAGLGSMSTANIAGAEALRVNVAGLGRARGFELNVSNMQYLGGTGIDMNALGFAAPLGNGQTLGVTVAALSFGDILQTTENQPEGTATFFSPTYFHIGLGYAKTFEEQISVGVGLRFISEAIYNVSATGFALDAGVQYVSGANDEFKLGISLRNVGLGMRFSGDGIAEQFQEPVDGAYAITAQNRVADFELPFQLNIGSSYDVPIDPNNTLVLLGNFTSNAFSRDNVGAGLEYSFRDLFMVRGGYNAEVGVSSDDDGAPLQTGLTFGVSGGIPLGSATNSEGRRRVVYVDYAYNPTQIYDGNHNFSVRLHL